MKSDLEKRFDQIARQVYEDAKLATGYLAKRYHQKVQNDGGLQAAKSWLKNKGGTAKTTGGFMKLVEFGRLDLSLEAQVIKEPWSSLFTESELAVARNRLAKYGYFDTQRKQILRTYLLTWNPKQKPWPELEEFASKTNQGELVDEWWNVANKRVVSGDRLFLLKQGPKLPKGIMASGYATSPVGSRPHWKVERRVLGEEVAYVDAKWETLLNPESESLLQVSAIQSDALPLVNWNTKGSGIEIHPKVARRLEVLWNLHVEDVRGQNKGYVLGGIDLEEVEFPEGRLFYRLHRYHERDPDLPKTAKAAALQRGEKIACTVCRFDFFAEYGDVGKDFIECHHVIPVSDLKPGMKTKLSDVVLVCSNCHRMLHRKRPWLGIIALKNLLEK